MKTIEEIYRIRLQILAEEAGSQRKLADKIGRSPSQINQWIKGAKDSKTGKPRSMERSTARYIEQMTGKPEGWMDQPIEDESNAAQTRYDNVKYLQFDLLNVHASCGPGIVASDHHEVVERLDVLESWALANIGGDLSRIKLITAKGTSMQGTVENGDVLFVDSTVRSYDGDGIYVIARGSDVQVKRLQKMHGDVLAIISDNRLFEPEKLTGEEISSLFICGRVLAAWSLKRFW